MVSVLVCVYMHVRVTELEGRPGRRGLGHFAKEGFGCGGLLIRLWTSPGLWLRPRVSQATLSAHQSRRKQSQDMFRSVVHLVSP